MTTGFDMASGSRSEVAMKKICAATFQGVDPAVSHKIRPGEEWHAAVTDMPTVIDMSHADPRTWHRLPSTQTNKPNVEELDQPIGFGFETAMVSFGFLGFKTPLGSNRTSM